MPAVGTFRITLFEPSTRQTESGEIVPAAGGTMYIRRVVQRDRGGRETLVGETSAGSWTREWEIPKAGLDLNTRWTLNDEQGRRYDIESVDDLPASPRRYWLVRGVRHEG